MLDELLAHPGVEERVVVAGPVGFMALHGGIEVGSLEVAEEAATRIGAGFYGVLLPPDLWWHVPSTEFSPRHSRRLAAFLGAVSLVFSIHGYGRPEWGDTVLLGGGNRRVAAELADALARRGMTAETDLERMPTGLRGVHPANPVNLTEHGGVQVELPPSLRRGSAAAAVVDALVAVAAAEARSLCARRGSAR